MSGESIGDNIQWKEHIMEICKWKKPLRNLFTAFTCSVFWCSVVISLVIGGYIVPANCNYLLFSDFCSENVWCNVLGDTSVRGFFHIWWPQWVHNVFIQVLFIMLGFIFIIFSSRYWKILILLGMLYFFSSLVTLILIVMILFQFIF